MKSLRLTKIATLLLLIFASIIHAQNSVRSNAYLIEHGDRMDVVVEGYPEYSRKVYVRRDGFISYPLIGEIKAENLSIEELEREIVNRLSNRLDRPRVFVTLLQQGTQNSIYLTGMVNAPGRYFFKSDRLYISQALSLAGGVKYERAKLTEIQLWRKGKIFSIVDLKQLAINGDQSGLPLEPNDLLFVPSLLQQRPIFVTGAVIDPGKYELETPEIHPLQALMMAGGADNLIAELKHAEVLRGDGTRLKLDLTTATQDSSHWLRPGDLLHIPNAYETEKISVIGAVKRPGQFQIREPIRPIEALSLAGGWEQELANLKKIQIFRVDGTKEVVDLLKIITDPNHQPEILIMPGDRVQVPRRFRVNWSSIVTVLSLVTLVQNMLR